MSTRAPVSTRKAWLALARNDIRGTYRDPLLVMLVVAPVIWTLGARIIVPRLSEVLAQRYDFDLEPYYPLVHTGLLLLTSIIIVGGLAAFLVLDEVDAGTLTALRVTPVSRRTFLGYRACTVVVVTTLYVVATGVFSGLLGPGMAPALIPIGVLSGVCAVVVLLMIVSVSGNKIQGLAVLRGLGMLVAGLPCLPWFVDSAWGFAFGVLPPYWPSKAFWLASAGEAWWPYLVVGLVYNTALAGVLGRRFSRREFSAA